MALEDGANELVSPEGRVEGRAGFSSLWKLGLERPDDCLERPMGGRRG